MRIMIAAIHWPVASGRYMRDAFKRCGADVRTVGYSSGPHVWGVKVDDKYTWQPDGDLTAYWPDWTPDLIVIMDSSWAYHSPMYPDVPHVVYGVDNHVRDYTQPGIARYFLGHKAVSLMPWSHTEAASEFIESQLDVLTPTMKRGDPQRLNMAHTVEHDDMEWLPCGYDPQWFSPSPIPWAERKWDVAMIGVMYPRRMELVQALGDAGLNVVAGTGPIYEQYRDIYWDARISLCVSAAGDVAQRVFETAAMGCYILSDPLPDLIELELGVSVETFTTPEEAVKKAKDILKSVKNHEVFNFSEHTWDARARRIMDWHAAEYGKAARHAHA